MDKPLLVKRMDFIEALARLINITEVPSIMLIDILNDAAAMLKDAHAREEKKAIDEYMASLQNEKEEDNVSKETPVPPSLS